MIGQQKVTFIKVRLKRCIGFLNSRKGQIEILLAVHKVPGKELAIITSTLSYRKS